MSAQWQVWGRRPFRFVVAKMVFSDWAGSGYRFARRGNSRGSIARFWTRRGAQKHADWLNLGDSDHG